jgi:energy-coupling factor transporter transmembrane protein EcfT
LFGGDNAEFLNSILAAPGKLAKLVTFEGMFIQGIIISIPMTIIFVAELFGYQVNFQPFCLKKVERRLNVKAVDVVAMTAALSIIKHTAYIIPLSLRAFKIVSDLSVAIESRGFDPYGTRNFLRADQYTHTEKMLLELMIIIPGWFDPGPGVGVRRLEAQRVRQWAVSEPASRSSTFRSLIL